MAHEETADGSTLWVSTLVALSLMKLELAEGRVVGERRLIPGELGRIRDVRLGPDGFVHFVTDHSEGTLYRAEPFVEEAKGSGLEGTR
jgi:glucose/arabinose dehydrogenase